VKPWILYSIFALLFAGLIIFLATQSLDRADKWASVFAFFTALIAVAISLARNRRRKAAAAPEPTVPPMTPTINFNGHAGRVIQTNGAPVNFKDSRWSFVFWPRRWR
jgi:hypothetical protein